MLTHAYRVCMRRDATSGDDGEVATRAQMRQFAWRYLPARVVCAGVTDRAAARPTPRPATMRPKPAGHLPPTWNGRSRDVQAPSNTLLRPTPAATALPSDAHHEHGAAYARPRCSDEGGGADDEEAATEEETALNEHCPDDGDEGGQPAIAPVVRWWLHDIAMRRPPGDATSARRAPPLPSRADMDTLLDAVSPYNLLCALSRLTPDAPHPTAEPDSGSALGALLAALLEHFRLPAICLTPAALPGAIAPQFAERAGADDDAHTLGALTVAFMHDTHMPRQEQAAAAVSTTSMAARAPSSTTSATRAVVARMIMRRRTGAVLSSARHHPAAYRLVAHGISRYYGYGAESEYGNSDVESELLTESVAQLLRRWRGTPSIEFVQWCLRCCSRRQRRAQQCGPRLLPPLLQRTDVDRGWCGVLLAALSSPDIAAADDSSQRLIALALSLYDDMTSGGENAPSASIVVHLTLLDRIFAIAADDAAEQMARELTERGALTTLLQLDESDESDNDDDCWRNQHRELHAANGDSANGRSDWRAAHAAPAKNAARSRRVYSYAPAMRVLAMLLLFGGCTPVRPPPPPSHPAPTTHTTLCDAAARVNEVFARADGNNSGSATNSRVIRSRQRVAAAAAAATPIIDSSARFVACIDAMHAVVYNATACGTLPLAPRLRHHAINFARVAMRRIVASTLAPSSAGGGGGGSSGGSGRKNGRAATGACLRSDTIRAQSETLVACLSFLTTLLAPNLDVRRDVYPQLAHPSRHVDGRSNGDGSGRGLDADNDHHDVDNDHDDHDDGRVWAALVRAAPPGTALRHAAVCALRRLLECHVACAARDNCAPATSNTHNGTASSSPSSPPPLPPNTPACSPWSLAVHALFDVLLYGSACGRRADDDSATLADDHDAMSRREAASALRALRTSRTEQFDEEYAPLLMATGEIVAWNAEAASRAHIRGEGPHAKRPRKAPPDAAVRLTRVHGMLLHHSIA